MRDEEPHKQIDIESFSVTEFLVALPISRCQIEAVFMQVEIVLTCIVE